MQIEDYNSSFLTPFSFYILVAVYYFFLPMHYCL